MSSHDFLDSPTNHGDLGILGHYRVMDELGKGGMGFVFRAEDVKLKRAVALKVMNQKIAATPNSRKRFIEEARAMAAVHHDNVVTIFEVGESKGTPFMAMEMLKGETLETLNGSNQRLGFEQVINYARQISRGLAAAHQKGIVHRDIKPANIWIVSGTGRIKILDFGLALASTPVDHLAGRGAVIGTPGYLSPEQARTEPLDDRSDLYSLGVVLYELCTGQLPILAKSVPGQLISILAHRPTAIQELNPDIPKPLCDLIHKLLRKEPRSRPSSADELCSELDRVEKECHAKSEVAQAINKLQMGLSEVVNKQPSAESLFDAASEPVIPDPLATLADPFAAIAAPAPTGVPVSPAAIPTSPVAPMPAARPMPSPRKSPAAPPPTDWKSYWPLAAIVAVVLIALPILTYAFSGRGRGNTAYIVASEDNSDPLDASADRNAPGDGAIESSTRNHSDTSGNNPSTGNPIVNDGSGQANQQGNANSDGQRRNRENQWQDNDGRNNGPTNGQADQKTFASQPSGTSSPPESGNQSQPGVSSVSSGQAGSDASTPRSSNLLPSTNMAAVDPLSAASGTNRSSTQTEATPEPPANTVEMKWTSISTDAGRGADAMVQINTNQKFGLNPSIGVRQRGNVESNHSYIRFDLTEIEELQRHVKGAELILSVIGKNRPVGATLNLYGLNVGIWPEEELDWKKSFSPKGLDSHPLLARIEVTDEIDPRDTQRNVIRISTPELAKFISNASEDTVTFALSGTAGDSSFVRFISREQSPTRAPTLRVHTPAVAPPDDGGQRRNRNRQ